MLDMVCHYKAGIIKHDDNNDLMSSKSNSSDGDHFKKGEKVNGTLDPEVLELRRQIEKQATDLGSAHRSLSDLRSKNAELEERLMQVNKELHGAQEFAKSLDIDLKVSTPKLEFNGKTVLEMMPLLSILKLYIVI